VLLHCYLLNTVGGKKIMRAMKLIGKITTSSARLHAGTIKFLTKGCSCKKGCATNTCGCKKKNNHCGPGCECRGCTNVPGTHQQNVTDTDEDSSSSSDSDGTASDSEENDMETEIITDEFLFTVKKDVYISHVFLCEIVATKRTPILV